MLGAIQSDSTGPGRRLAEGRNATLPSGKGGGGGGEGLERRGAGGYKWGLSSSWVVKEHPDTETVLDGYDNRGEGTIFLLSECSAGICK